MTEITISEQNSNNISKRDQLAYESTDINQQNLIYQENKNLLQNNLINPSVKVSERTSCNITSSNSINV